MYPRRLLTFGLGGDGLLRGIDTPGTQVLDFQKVGVDFPDEARGYRFHLAEPETGGGAGQKQPFAGARGRHVKQPPLFFELGWFRYRPLQGKQSLLQPDDINIVKLKPLGGMDCHHGQLILNIFVLVNTGKKRYFGEVFIQKRFGFGSGILRRPLDKSLNIFHPRRSGDFVFFEKNRYQVKVLHQILYQNIHRGGVFQGAVFFDKRHIRLKPLVFTGECRQVAAFPGYFIISNPVLPGQLDDVADGFRPDTAPGIIYRTFKRNIIPGIGNHPQVRCQILNFLAFVK